MDLIRLIRETLPFESSAVFIVSVAAICAIGGGATAWLIDRAYQKERASATDETARFFVVFAGVEPVRIVGAPSPAPLLFQLRTAFENPRKHAASKIRYRLVATTATLEEAPSIDISGEHTTKETHKFQIEARVNVSQNIPATFVVVELNFVDALTIAPQRQSFFWRWSGVRNGFFADNFSSLPTDDVAKLQRYLSSLPLSP